jgi:hypothetical protein
MEFITISGVQGLYSLYHTVKNVLIYVISSEYDSVATHKLLRMDSLKMYTGKVQRTCNKMLKYNI